MSEKKSNVKKRNWTFLVYPESAPENWLDILRETGLACAISPLHEFDVDESTGEVKKPHWHVIVIYSGPTSFNVVNALCSQLNAPIPKAIESVRGVFRYLTHKDNPEKHQYSENDIRCLNGFDIMDFVELTKSEVNKIMKELQQLIRAEKIFEYCELMDYLQDNDLSAEYDIASSHTYFFDRYITSRRNRHSTKKEGENNEI